MASFDIVSETDVQQVSNAVDRVGREITQRYDFKGTQCEISLGKDGDKDIITIRAESDYQLDQIQQMLKANMVRSDLDAKALDFAKAESASGATLRQTVTVKQGVPTDTAKQIVKDIKSAKIKVQASIRGDSVRVDSKKRDDLQEVIQLVKDKELDLPLQFINFRD